MHSNNFVKCSCSFRHGENVLSEKYWFFEVRPAILFPSFLTRFSFLSLNILVRIWVIHDITSFFEKRSRWKFMYISEFGRRKKKKKHYIYNAWDITKDNEIQIYRPIPTVFVKWCKVALRNAKKLPKNGQKI